jgi:hypothetical protein
VSALNTIGFIIHNYQINVVDFNWQIRFAGPNLGPNGIEFDTGAVGAVNGGKYSLFSCRGLRGFCSSSRQRRALAEY